MKYIISSIFLFYLIAFTACTFKHFSFPNDYRNRIESNLKLLTPLILNEYRTDTAVVTRKMYRDEMVIENGNLKKTLENLQVRSLILNYKVDTTGKSKFLAQIPDDIFNSISYLDSSIELYKDTRISALDKWETSYGVIYMFGNVKRKIAKQKDQFNNLIQPINDSVFIIRQNTPKTR